MNCFNVSLTEIEELSFDELDKWSAAALWVKLEIDLAPYKQKK